MSIVLSDECKEKIKDLEEKLIWAQIVLEESGDRFIFTPEYLAFLALTCRFNAQHIDDDDECKKLMAEFEKDIACLWVQTASEQASEFKSILSRVQQALN